MSYLWGGVLFLGILMPAFTSSIDRWHGINFQRTTSFSGSVLAIGFAMYFYELFRGRSFFDIGIMRVLRSLWAAWSRDRRWLYLSACIVGALWSYVSMAKHWEMRTSAFDLGIFGNSLWNFNHGFGFMTPLKGELSLFTDHQSPILLLFAPIYALFPRGETLLAIQGFALASAAVPLYFLSLRVSTDPRVPPFLPWVYWLYMPIRTVNAFEFHTEVLMVPCFIWAVAACEARRWGWGFFALFLTLMCKESAGPVVAGMGLAWILSRQYWLGCGWLFLGCATFLVDTQLVPKIFGVGYAYQDCYKHFGPTLRDVLFAPFVQPIYFFHHIISGERIYIFKRFLFPLAYLPLLSHRVLPAVPGFLMLFMSGAEQKVSFWYHYSIEPAVGLLCALPFGINRLMRYFNPTLCIILLLAVSYADSGSNELMRREKHGHSKRAAWILNSIIPHVAKDIPISATDGWMPHLMDRHWINYFYEMHEYDVPCVIYDRFGVPGILPPGTLETLEPRLLSRGYHVEWDCYGITMYSRGASCLTTTLSCP